MTTTTMTTKRVTMGVYRTYFDTPIKVKDWNGERTYLYYDNRGGNPRAVFDALHPAHNNTGRTGGSPIIILSYLDSKDGKIHTDVTSMERLERFLKGETVHP